MYSTVQYCCTVRVLYIRVRNHYPYHCTGWHTNNSPMTQISQVYILPLWISDHLHEKFKNLNIPFFVLQIWVEDHGRLVYLNIFPLWWSVPFPASRLSQFLRFSWLLLIWQSSCNFFSITFFTYRFYQVMRNIKRTIFYIECTLLKRPPSGRKVWSTIKSVSPRTVIGGGHKFFS